MELSLKIYEHAAALIQSTPWEASTHAALLYKAHAEAYRLYRHHPITPAIDHYNIEAEAYGATVERPYGSGVPAIVKPPLKSVSDILQLAPFNPTTDGRFPMIFDVGDALAREFKEATISIPVSGAFSIATGLVGFETLLCAVVEDPIGVSESLLHLVEGQIALATEIRSHGFTAAFAESAAGPPLLSPAQFRRTALPAIKELLHRMAQVFGSPIPFVLGGNTLLILDDILQTETDYVICPRETDQAAFLDKMRSRNDIHVRINMDSSIVATGDWIDIKCEADRIIRLSTGRSNTSLGVGVLPFETIPANVLKLQEYVINH